ncbi:peptidylprolyl isomerase [Lysobacter soyae]|uniref:peptidylprolyl isomerase n=1 Tax=Lysobacter soyae TaxID=2764185 RepID=A0ABX8WS92_9GAMM|nr:peptidylprolyl isomerase [Lysobacter sp. CJ11]QYR53695.1 peptidylprolyl isomerase [Lysobacter sp. CJ11]
MNRHIARVTGFAALFATALWAGGLRAEGNKPTYQSANQIIDAAPATAWRTPDPSQVLYMDLADGKRVIIELAPHFAPQHVANIQALAHGGFWDGLSIYRSQDNYVVQFGDPDADDATKAKPLSAGAKPKLVAEFERSSKQLPFHRLKDVDGWAPETGFSNGFPAARDPATQTAWMTHCYGTLGAGRGNEADSSTGAELYVIIGDAPRGLDRNITVVGRVLQGMENLSVIPRGPAPMGFFEDPAKRVPIKSIRLEADVPVAERTPLQVFRTDTVWFDRAIEARRNRRDEWYKRPANHIGICSVAPVVRTPK